MIDQELLRDLTESYLKSLIAEASGALHPDFDSSAAFAEMGINSFQVLKILKKLESDFGRLPKSLLFENFTVHDLANYFMGKHEQTLSVRFAGELQGSVDARPPAASSVDPLHREAAPILMLEKDARAHPGLRPIIETLFDLHKMEGGISRGTRKIAPNLFIGSERRGYFNYGRSKGIVLVYAYTGPRDYLPVLFQELHGYCAAEGLQLNILSDEQIPPISGTAFSATPFGVLQRIVNLREFALDGGAMRRLRYQVAKFEKCGRSRTEEYRCGSNPETDQKIAGIIDRWCESKTMVNPLVLDVKEEILAGALPLEHRLFLTYVDDVLQNVILITPMCAEQNGYLMDLEFYPPDMHMGGLEFAIVQIIAVLAGEGCDVLSLGGTYGCKLDPSADADPEIDKILDELREQNIVNDEGNLQFKNKFRPQSKSIYLCRPVGSGNPENVIDIIMMIADPEKMRTAVDETRDVSAAPAAAALVEKASPPEVTRAGSGRQVIEGNDRSGILADCGFNPLNVPSEHVELDLKTDSWAQLEMPAIEAQMRHLRAQLQEPAAVDDSLRAIFPFAHFVLTASGQAAEHIFFKAWPKKGVVPQNLLFPSTIFHQIDNGFTPSEMPHAEAFHLESAEQYQGNMDWDALHAQVTRDPAAIAFVCIEVNNNAAGGKPVSMRHLRDVKALLAGHSIPLVMDATRVVENAQFLIERDQEHSGKSLWAVVREILSCADAVIGSLTKDFCVNKGGIVCTNDAELFHRLQELLHEEGAGIDPIDRKVIALSLRNRKHIEAGVLRRMENARMVWRALGEHGVPVARPAGGHCVLIDVKQIPEFKDFREPVASFLAWMYLNSGIRAGAHSVGMQTRAALNGLVRLAIPVGLKGDQIDGLIDRFIHAFARKANIPEVVLESSAPQPLGGVHAKYKLIGYHNVSGRIAAGSDSASLARSSPEPGPSPHDVVTPPEPESPIRANAGARRTHDIAIVGMAGRYPKAKNPSELWDNLAQGRDCIEEIPPDRYERRVKHGSVEKYRGGFIDDVDKFDSLFFNISPREAEMLDPQERLFLEVAWETIEDAGYYPEILAREDAPRDIGVFVGAVWAMYQMLGVEEKHLGNRTVPNSFLWSIANRVSYALNVAGPSLTVDTACSSSLTALYLACQSIRAGECSAAIVGGVNLDLHQTKFDINHQGGALSADGVCRSFGKGANGYVMGEGVGALFLKPLDRAVQDGDNIYGVIKSAAINHGGRTSGYTVPNPKAQADLIKSALEKAGVDAQSIGYIEAHGTGTELGDPIEITALSNAFRSPAVANQTCAIGSIKTNIGHLEAAAGVVSVSKVLLQMKHRQLAPSLHSSEPNELIEIDQSPFYVVQRLEEWKAREVDGVRLPLRAGVSSFGAGGANAHIVLESYEPIRQAGEERTEARPLIFPLSARNEDQLRESAIRLAEAVRRNHIGLDDAAFTLQHGRKSFDHRLAVVATTKEELLEKLTGFLDGKRTADIATGHVKSGEAVTRLLNRREKQEFVRLVSQGRDPHKMAALWAEGLLADWQGFPSDGSGKRISLPTYPFADKRHWAGDSSPVRRALQPAASVHPMVDTNESTFERQLFKKTFHERDFFIYDHRVSEIPTLPGVAYLELARKAGELAAGRKVQKIKNILWVSPIAVPASTSKEVLIELKPSGDSVQFEVFSEDAAGNKTLHSQGKLLYATSEEAAAAPQFIDIESVRARCAKVIDGDEAYPLFKSFGLSLGPSFQVLQDVYKNEVEALGVLKLPDFREDDLQSMVLHPSLMDGSLQAGMAAQFGDHAGEMFVPYSIGEVEILQPLQPRCFSYVTAADDNKSSRVLKSNVLIVDEAGKVLVKIRDSVGVPLRQVHEKPARHEADGVSPLYYSYGWEKAPLAAAGVTQSGPPAIVLFDTADTSRDLYAARLREAGANADHVILVRPGDRFRELDGRSYTIDPQSKDDFTRLFDSLIAKGCPVENICFAWSGGHAGLHDGKSLEEALARGVYAFLFVCQSIIEHKLENQIQLLYLSSGKPDEARPHDEAMTGFVNALHLEHPRLLSKTLTVRQESADCEEVLDAVSAELRARTQDAAAVRYEARERSIKKLKAFELEDAAGASRPLGIGLREKGVYLITGGAGGLGLIFAEFLAKECHARLVLTGRSALSAERAARVDELGKSGAEVLYLPADVSSGEDVGNLVAEIKSRFGAINGIIHAAGVVRDSLVRNKTAEEMRAVFAPKVLGTLHLDELTKDEELDFFVTFSSLAAVTGNAGQCDYSFANHFMDSFAIERELRRANGARPGKTLSVNWSLWADGGMKLDEQTELYFKKTMGISLLSAATGLDAFMRGLASPRSQFAVLEGVQEKVELAWGLRKRVAAPATPMPSANQAVSAPVPAGGDTDLLPSLQNDLSRIVMEFLKLDASDVASDAILLDLGFDSIGLTTFANAVNEKYQLDITPVLFFDYPSIGEIAKYLSVERKDEIHRFYRGSVAAPAIAAPPPTQQRPQTEGAEQTATLAIRKGWNPAVIDRDAVHPTSGGGLSLERRFIDKPIAIVGMSGVMPQSDDLEEFWENLQNSKDMIEVIPADRWRWEDYYGDPLKEVNKSNSKWGGFMKEIDKFDPLFFGISPREAQMMDPQQRIFLEQVWKAIEDSGQKVSDLSGTKTGLFVGVATNDYIEVMNGGSVALDGYSASGNSHSVLANRVSFLLNLRGPSAPLDTACSSSLVALHRAIESIHTGSSDMAIVGGVQVMLSPAAYISFGMAGMLSGDGKCKTFDKRANGYVRGEGCGAIFIKSLSAAESDGNHIYAVIKATSENHGGRVTTMTAPNSSAQAELLVDAYEKAQIDPATVGYIECHGTGTSLGDPIEIQSLTKAFSELYKRRNRAPAAVPHCGLSSVKTNIGHLETAAGIAGLLKTLLAIEHKQIPANVHFEEINPYINLKGTPFYIADRLTPWAAPVGEDGSSVPRRAGVSSFGFGGANAHIVLEEYIPRRRPSPAAASQPQLIVLSAKNDDRLDAYVRSMLAYLGKHEIDLIDFAYTLQVGRDEMPERLAFVASSTGELKRRFEEILGGGDAAEGSYRNRVANRAGKAQTADPAMAEPVLQALVERRELSKLAELWVSGAKIDWRSLYESDLPARISLPTYPFARERYWIPDADGKTTQERQRQVAAGPALLHPLVHRNTSTLQEQRFSSRFSGEEFYLSDHVVETQKILPGVAYLEMARAAGELSGNAPVRVIRNLTWERPLVVGNDGKEVEISMVPVKDEVKFAVRSVDGGSVITHCTGRLAYQAGPPAPEALDIAAIKQRCPEQVISGRDLYPLLSGSGLKLGRGFQIVQSIYASESESLAILQLPEHLEEEAGQFWLHPALMDGSLHTAIGLMKKNGMGMPLSLPFSVGEVQILHPLKDLHYGYATWAADHRRDNQTFLKADFHLLDKNGRVLVRLKDFVSRPIARDTAAATAREAADRPLGAASQQGVEGGLQSLVPVWNPVRIEASRRIVLQESAEILLLGGDQAQLGWARASFPNAQFMPVAVASSGEAIAKRLVDCSFDQLLWIAPDVRPDGDRESGGDELMIARQEEGVLALFRVIKALLQAGYATKKLQWTIVTGATQGVTEAEPTQPAHAGIVGLVGSLAKEYPQWDVRLLSLDALASASAVECLSLPWDKQGSVLAHRKAEWFQQGLAVMGALPEAPSAYRPNGVYVVIGGAGGVGEVWSRFMIEHYQAQMVWIGRHERNAAIEAKIGALSRLGPAPLYISADAASVAALERARNAILAVYPAIHGVVHSAIVLQDQSLARMDESTFRASLSAKVDVSVNMERVFGKLELDFMLFFSSIASFVKSSGQSNYSAGCTFKDSFAHALRQRHSYPVKTMNWGYWGSVGVVADESYTRMMAQIGLGSIEPDEGMASLEALMSSKMSQVCVLKTLNGHATSALNLSEAVAYYPKTTPAILPQVQRELSERLPARPIAALEMELPTSDMTDFVTEILASTLGSLGLFSNGVNTIADLSLDKQPAPYYERWLRSSVRYLQQQGVLADDLTLGRDLRALPDLWQEWEAKRPVWASAPNLQAQVALLEACLKALPAVLTARRLATDVMFPNSSMQLVEGIYRGNAVADHFNEVLGGTLIACIERQLLADSEREIRILEIGAGTGGTTAALLPALQRFPIAEYCYTDVSRAFLMYAEQQYKPALPALTTAIFDVSKPLAPQSIAEGHYDFAIAANVLHATPDIRQTLRNAKAALKNDGILLLNEISAWSLFSHLTFGLLEGWWLNEDTAIRLPGSPGLAPEQWRELLAEEGFESILFPAEGVHKFGQQIVAAESNGWTRQRIVNAVPARRSDGAEQRSEKAMSVAATNPTRPATRTTAPAELTEQKSSDHVRRTIAQTLSEALRMDAAAIRNDAPFADYGVDSIIGVNFVRTVSEALQIELETTSLFEYSTVDQLTEYIVTNWGRQIAGPVADVRDVPQASSRATEEARSGADAPSEHGFTGSRRFANARGTFNVVRDTGSETINGDPIAIIGMSGRFAGSESVDAFWHNLAHGKDLVTKVSRWDAVDCVMPDSAAQSYCSYGSFIDTIDRFDPAFFGISPQEAMYMDPQQRLFLEESWKALEDAGYAGASVHEKRCGVYVGCGNSNYDRLFAAAPPPQAFWGNAESVLPARIAYHLDLQGPAMAIDTACSSSLVAIHLACQGLWSRETDMALAGGVFLQPTPRFYQVANRAGMLSSDGRCYSFDARANGFVPGEGVGVVVMKRLRDALEDGDSIHGVIAGSGINQDGRSNGLIAPNGRAQERLERSVYDRFGINPETIQVIEAHATGTILGDSVEYGAISRSFREYTDKKQFCALGTVKTNIGHAAAAAGVAGVLKLLLSLKHRQIAPSLNFEKANPAIELEAGPFYVNTELKEWEVGSDGRRRAAISSFGFSGTNAHLVIEEAPPRAPSMVRSPGYLVVLSARTGEQLKQQVLNLLELVRRTPDLSMNDLSFSLFVGRTHLAHRLACLACSQDEMIQLLEQWDATGSARQVFTSEGPEGKVRNHVSLQKIGNRCIEECRNAADPEYLENLAAIADLYAQGYTLDFDALFSGDSKRIPLPSYPFAREHYWVDAVPAAGLRPTASPSTRLHPLLHANTSTLGLQSYSSVLTGAELFMDGQQLVRPGPAGPRVLPDTAYLEMARAAVEKASSLPPGSAIVELRDIVWGEPMEVTGSEPLTISLFANDDGLIHYEIHSGDAVEELIHCQGQAISIEQRAPALVNIDDLRGRMQRTLDADAVYAALETGLQSGAAHRPIVAVHQGDQQLLARLSLPTAVTSDDCQSGYWMHPSMMTAALQAGGRLIADPARRTRAPISPQGLGRLRALSPCTEEMFAWARRAQESAPDDEAVSLDIDLIDAKGNVCVEMRSLSFQLGDAAAEPAAHATWLFSAEQSSMAGNRGSMGAAEKMELFLRQETALQLQVPIDGIPTGRSYFDLGLTSLGLTDLIQKTNRILGATLSPSVLFEYRDIQSLAAYLALAFPAKIDALAVVRRNGSPAHAAEPRPPHAAKLRSIRRRMRSSSGPEPRPEEQPRATASSIDMSGEQCLESVLWQEASLDDSYERVAF